MVKDFLINIGFESLSPSRREAILKKKLRKKKKKIKETNTTREARKIKRSLLSSRPLKRTKQTFKFKLN